LIGATIEQKWPNYNSAKISVEYEVDIEASIENRKKFWAGAEVPALFLNKIYIPKMSA
jgi:hypothetical protein